MCTIPICIKDMRICSSDEDRKAKQVDRMLKQVIFDLSFILFSSFIYNLRILPWPKKWSSCCCLVGDFWHFFNFLIFSGAAEGGKSTILKQMKSIGEGGEGVWLEDLIIWIDLINSDESFSCSFSKIGSMRIQIEIRIRLMFIFTYWREISFRLQIKGSTFSDTKTRKWKKITTTWSIFCICRCFDHFVRFWG